MMFGRFRSEESPCLEGEYWSGNDGGCGGVLSREHRKSAVHEDYLS